MKFFTSEWDYASRRTMLGFNLNDDDERARGFDEALFNEAYEQAYQFEYDMMKGVHKVSYVDLAIKMNRHFYEADEMSKEDYEAALEEARRRDAEKPPFSE